MSPVFTHPIDPVRSFYIEMSNVAHDIDKQWNSFTQFDDSFFFLILFQMNVSEDKKDQKLINSHLWMDRVLEE